MNLTINTTVPGTWDYESCGGMCCLRGTAAVYSYAFALILLSVISTMENLLVLIAILKHEALRTPSILLFEALAVIDLLTGCIVTPIKAGLTFKRDYGWFHTFWWTFTAVVFFSLSTILMIAIDRFFHVYFMERYTVTKKKLFLAMLIGWIPSFVLTICVAFGWHGINLHMFALGLFFFCVVTMVITYIGMILALKKHASNVDNNRDASNTDNEMRRSGIENERQAVKTTLIIAVTCILMNLPPALAFYGLWSRTFCAITFFVFLANSAVNPVIYCLRIPVMKKHVLQLLRCEMALRADVDSDDAFLTLDVDADV